MKLIPALICTAAVALGLNLGQWTYVVLHCEYRAKDKLRKKYSKD